LFPGPTACAQDVLRPPADGYVAVSGWRGLEAAVRERSREVKIALVLNELRDRDVLDRDGIVGIGCDHRVPIAIIMRRRQQRLKICKNRVIDFDHIRLGVEIRDSDVAEISGKHERVAIGGRRCGRCGRGLRRRAGLSGIARCRLRVCCGAGVCNRGGGSR
jgi:hypothetical protein